jgi:hypothetical protein
MRDTRVAPRALLPCCCCAHTRPDMHGVRAHLHNTHHVTCVCACVRACAGGGECACAGGDAGRPAGRVWHPHEQGVCVCVWAVVGGVCSRVALRTFQMALLWWSTAHVLCLKHTHANAHPPPGQVRDMVGANPIVLVGTKMDLLPPGCAPKDVAAWLTDAAARRRLQVRARARAGSTPCCCCCCCCRPCCGCLVHVPGSHDNCTVFQAVTKTAPAAAPCSHHSARRTPPHPTAGDEHAPRQQPQWRGRAGGGGQDWPRAARARRVCGGRRQRWQERVCACAAEGDEQVGVRCGPGGADARWLARAEQPPPQASHVGPAQAAALAPQLCCRCCPSRTRPPALPALALTPPPTTTHTHTHTQHDRRQL